MLIEVGSMAITLQRSVLVLSPPPLLGLDLFVHFTWHCDVPDLSQCQRFFHQDDGLRRILHLHKLALADIGPVQDGGLELVVLQQVAQVVFAHFDHGKRDADKVVADDLE